MKTTYKGNKYYVTFFDNIKISCYKLFLIIKRLYRYIRIFLVKKNLLFFILLTTVWLLIVGLLKILGTTIFNYDIADAILDILLAYITSVIITMFISLYNQAEQYHTTLRLQYQIYINVNYTFDELFEPFLKNIIYHYMPFYNDKCLREALRKSRNYTNLPGKEFIVNLENALEVIRTIKSQKRSNLILDNEFLDIYIDEAEKELRALMFKVRDNKFEWEQFENTVFKLGALADCLRNPWRKDLKIEQKILCIIEKQNKSLLLDDFYIRMWLYSIDDILDYVEETLGLI